MLRFLSVFEAVLLKKLYFDKEIVQNNIPDFENKKMIQALNGNKDDFKLAKIEGIVL